MDIPSLNIFLQLQLWRVKESLYGNQPIHATGPKKPDMTGQENEPKK